LIGRSIADRSSPFVAPKRTPSPQLANQLGLLALAREITTRAA
jgi:hypothetical protein